MPVEPDAPDMLERAYAAFEAEHRRINGHATGAPAKIVNLRVVLSAALPDPFAPGRALPGPSLKGTRAVWFSIDGPRDAAVHDRTRIAAGETVPGPAVLEQADTTTLVPPGWQATALPDLALILTRREDA